MRGIEACAKLSRASSCLFLGRSRSTSLRHPRFPRIGGFHEQRPPVTGIIILSPGNASRLGLDRMCFMSFHVSEGGLEGLLPSPARVHRRPRAVATSGVTSTFTPLTGDWRAPARTISKLHTELGRIGLRPDTGQQQQDGTRRIRIELWPTAHRFKAGHRVRLQVSSGSHPRYARNLGSGEPLATATTFRVAEQHVFHDPDHPSAIAIPVRRHDSHHSP